MLTRSISRCPKILVCLLCLAIVGLAGGRPRQQVPKAVSDIQGVYQGAWAMFGIDEKEQVVKRFSWTDTIRAENATLKEDRAFVTITDEMTFEGNIPPRKTVGTEGYLLNKDGSLGDYFFETGGRVLPMKRLDQNVWSYVTAATPQELAQLGFRNVVSGQHVLVKVITYEQGVETHRVSRLTTVNWKDAAGKERWIQFISLQGFHKRQMK